MISGISYNGSTTPIGSTMSSADATTIKNKLNQIDGKLDQVISDQSTHGGISLTQFNALTQQELLALNGGSEGTVNYGDPINVDTSGTRTITVGDNEHVFTFENKHIFI